MLTRLSLLLLPLASLLPVIPGAQSTPASPQDPRAPGLDLPLELVASRDDPRELHQTGIAMVTAGEHLFVGAPGHGNGRVDVWRRGAFGYQRMQSLFLPGALSATDGEFGRSLAADGRLLVVGTRTGNSSGRALLYRRAPGGAYAFEQVLEASNGNQDFSLFGDDLALLEDELIVASARGERSVHLFAADANGDFPTRSNRVLDPVNTQTTPDASWMTSWGSSVALHRTRAGEVTLLVGMQDACFYQQTQLQAPDEQTPNGTGSTAARTGGVAVLQRSGGTWSILHRLVPDWSKMKDFGVAIAVEGPYVAVGATYSRVFSQGHNAGTASLYRWDGVEFALVKTIWPSVPRESGRFGYSLDIAGGYLIVGQPEHWGGPQGSVEVFRITGNELLRADLLAAPDGNGAPSAQSLGDGFGRSVVGNDYGDVIVAAPFRAPRPGSTATYGGGALYLFR